MPKTLITLLILLGTCGYGPQQVAGTNASPATNAAPATTAPPATTTKAAPVTATTEVRIPLVRVEGGAKVEGPDTISVQQGRTVLFEVEADVADEVHVHGYDLSFATEPGEVVVVEFVADATGIFEVELERAGLPILDIEVFP